MAIQVVAEGLVWMTAECREALAAIQGNACRKKRNTVVLLACQEAGIVDGPKTKVFEDERACSESVWYMKWQYLETVKRALEVCTSAAQAWMDEETALVETLALQRVQRAVAASAEVPIEALQAIERDTNVRPSDRLEAIRRHLALLNPEYAARLAQEGAGALPVDVRGELDLGLGDVTPDELRIITDLMETLANQDPGSSKT
jgi:hypothetical protein